MELKIINLGNLIERNIANQSLDAIHLRYTNEPVAARQRLSVMQKIFFADCEGVFQPL